MYDLDCEKLLSEEELYKEDNKETKPFSDNDHIQNAIMIAKRYNIKMFGIEVINKKKQIYTATTTNKSNSSYLLLGSDVYNDVELFKKKILNGKEINSKTVEYTTKLAQQKLENFSNVDIGYSIIEDEKNNKVFVAVYSKGTKKVKIKEIQNANKKTSQQLNDGINKELETLVCNSILEIANKKRILQKLSKSKNRLERIHKSIETFVKFNPVVSKKKELDKLSDSVKKTLDSLCDKTTKFLNK